MHVMFQVNSNLSSENKTDVGINKNGMSYVVALLLTPIHNTCIKL